MILLAKQQRMRLRGVGARNDTKSVQTRRPFYFLRCLSLQHPLQNLRSVLKTTKTIERDALEELINGFRELRVEMSELRKSQASSSLQKSENAKEYLWRCIFCNKIEKESPKHKLRNRTECDEAVKDGIIIFINGKIHDAATKSPLSTNFGKGGMKKIMEEKMGRSSSIHVRGGET